MGLPSILLKQKSGPKKRKFAKEVKPRQKEIVCGRFLPALIAGQLIPFGATVSASSIWFNTILPQASGKVAFFRSRKYGIRTTLSDPFIRFSTEAACYKQVWHLIVQTPLLGANPVTPDARIRFTVKRINSPRNGDRQPAYRQTRCW